MYEVESKIVCHHTYNEESSLKEVESNIVCHHTYDEESSL